MPIQQWSDDIWLVQLGNEPALSEELVQAKDQAGRATQTPHMVIDFANVSHVNSSNLSQLLRLRKLATDRETRLCLAGLNDTIWAVFMTTGLDKVFTFAPDVMTALASMQMQNDQDSPGSA